jgi:hypothetical protein
MTVAGMQQCVQLNGMPVISTPMTLKWIDNTAMKLAKSGFDCEIANASRMCWESVNMAVLENERKHDSFFWLNGNESVPWGLLSTKPDAEAENASLGCATDCLMFYHCLPAKVYTPLTDPSLAFCTDERFFSVLDEGCVGMKWHVVNHLVVTLEDFNASHAIWDTARVLERFVPLLSETLMWYSSYLHCA